MTPEVAFSHPFISKAVNELKCLRTGSQGNAQAQGNNGSQHQSTAGESSRNAGNVRANKGN